MQDLGLCKVQDFAWAEPKLTPVQTLIKTRAGKQILRIMKLTAIILLTACLQVNAKGYSQKITLSVKDAPLEQVFKSIEKQSGFYFNYLNELIKQAHPVTVNLKNASLEEVLASCFKGQPFTYTIVNNDRLIIVNEKGWEPVAPTINPNLTAPAVDIKGRVTNERGEPLAGANITVKRTGKGTIADADGNFSLSNLNNEDIIVLSYIGYQTQNIKIGNTTNFTLVMEIATSSLDAVKVQAYGTTTDRLRTGNIATVTAAEIERQPVMNPLQAIQGRVPGLVITQTNGYASAPFKVELRGRSVINPNLPVQPLYIIDGVPLTVLSLSGSDETYKSGSKGYTLGMNEPAGGLSPLFNLNSDDIESITVLKDADALAIYGSRGANGVIIINTKSGKAGKSQFEANVYTGFSYVPRHYDMLNTREYLQIRREAFMNSNITPSTGDAYDLLVWDTTRYTNWQKVLWGGASNLTTVQLSMSGGDKFTTFRIATGYKGLKKPNTTTGHDQIGSLQINLSHKTANQRLGINLKGYYSTSNNDLISLGGSVILPPNGPSIYDNNGKLNFAGWAPDTYNHFSFGYLLRPYYAKTKYLNAGLKVKYELAKGLSFATDLGYSNTHKSQKYSTPIISQNPINNPTGRLEVGTYDRNELIIEPTLEFNSVVLGGKLNAIVGGTYSTNNADGLMAGGEGYVNDLLLRSIGNAPVRSTSDKNGEYKYVAGYGRLSYNFKNKYLINLSGRRDGSSRFGSGKQFGNFGSTGIAWIFSEERFFKTNLKFLSFGKIRASYGITGSDIIGDYRFLTRWSNSGINPYQGQPSYFPLQHANPQLQWQADKKLEAALNLGFLSDRLMMEVAWYQNRIGNQLVDYRLPSATGFEYVTANFPATVQNRGVEVTINTALVKRKDFNWSMNFNIGANKNILYSFPNIESSPYYADYVVGKPLNMNWVLHYTGVDPQTGLYTVEDINKDGQIVRYFVPVGQAQNHDLIVKNLSVKFDGGIGTDINVKNFTVNIFFQFRKKEEVSAINTISLGAMNNLPKQALDRWQKPGDKSRFAKPELFGRISDEYFSSSDGIYSDASYIRLNNISVSYDLSSKLLQRLKIGGGKMFVRGENLLLITNYEGVDPDVPAFGAMPISATIAIGFQIKF